jgi:hypothetical protein
MTLITIFYTLTPLQNDLSPSLSFPISYPTTTKLGGIHLTVKSHFFSYSPFLTFIFLINTTKVDLLSLLDQRGLGEQSQPYLIIP